MRRPYGAVNPVTILTIVAVIGAAYWLVCFGPKYLDNLDVKEATESAVASKMGDEQITQKIVISMQRVGWHREEDENGELVEKPGLALEPENVVIERDENAKTVVVTVRYTRDVHLIPFNKWTTATFTVQKSGTFGQ